MSNSIDRNLELLAAAKELLGWSVEDLGEQQSDDAYTHWDGATFDRLRAAVAAIEERME